MSAGITLPGIHAAANAASLAGQETTLRRARWSLRLGLLAAVAGIASWRVGDADLDVVAALGAVAFALAALLTVTKTADEAQVHWYRGRALAESAKTLTWKLAVGGDPFSADMPEVDARRLFTDRLDGVIGSFTDVQLPVVAGDLLPADVMALRSQPIAERWASYLKHRIDEQTGWYSGEAQANVDSARSWQHAVLGANAVGFLGATSRFLGWTDIDILGLAAAAAAAAAGWAQLRQHRNLATSYAVAAQDLALAKQRLLSTQTEEEWAAEVGDAEEAISREHTAWLARRGHSPRR